MPVHVINEANRCLQCKNPRCRMLGCPIQTNIPEVVRLFKENRMMEAAEILFENNPLSVVCSLVCNHENQCEGHCVRGSCPLSAPSSATMRISAKGIASVESRASLFTFLLSKTIFPTPALRGSIFPAHRLTV